MPRSISTITMSCLVLLPMAMTACGSVERLLPDYRPSERPEAPATLATGCPAPPPMPPRSALPRNDARPIVAVLLQQVDAGDQCRIVAEGWKAWDACMRARTKDPKADCPALDAILQQLPAPDPVPRAPTI